MATPSGLPCVEALRLLGRMHSRTGLGLQFVRAEQGPGGSFTVYPVARVTVLALLLFLPIVRAQPPHAADSRTCEDVDNTARLKKVLWKARSTRASLLRMLESLEEHGTDLGARERKARGGQAGGQADAFARAVLRVSAQGKRDEDSRLIREGKCMPGSDSQLGPHDWSKFTSAGTVAWVPQKDKFILLDCHKGQASNRIRCYSKALLIAGLLNRTAVVPYRRTELSKQYDPRVLLPLGPLWRCFGEDSIITLQQYRQAHGTSLTVNLGVCVRKPGDPRYPKTELCYAQDGWRDKDVMPQSPDADYTNASLLLLPNTESPPIKLGVLLQQLQSETADIRALMLEDVNALMLEQGDEFTALMTGHGDLPFFRKPGCPAAMAPQPHPAFLEAAMSFVKATKLGAPGRFAGLHWRRSDLLHTCDHWQCRLSPEETGACVAASMNMMGLEALFVATDGNRTEVAALHKALEGAIPGIAIVSISEGWQARSWAEAINKQQFSDAMIVRATMDKALCSLAGLFLGTRSSTFSQDISRLRGFLRRASCVDSYICGNPAREKPASA